MFFKRIDTNRFHRHNMTTTTDLYLGNKNLLCHFTRKSVLRAWTSSHNLLFYKELNVETRDILLSKQKTTTNVQIRPGCAFLSAHFVPINQEVYCPDETI